MHEERRILEEVELARFGPFEEVPSDLPGGPRTFFHGKTGIVWVASDARIAAESAGHAIVAEHPARPSVLARTARAIVFAPFGSSAFDPIARVASWPRS